jgi:hypothetical protein
MSENIAFHRDPSKNHKKHILYEVTWSNSLNCDWRTSCSHVKKHGKTCTLNLHLFEPMSLHHSHSEIAACSWGSCWAWCSTSSALHLDIQNTIMPHDLAAAVTRPWQNASSLAARVASEVQIARGNSTLLSGLATSGAGLAWKVLVLPTFRHSILIRSQMINIKFYHHYNWLTYFVILSLIRVPLSI